VNLGEREHGAGGGWLETPVDAASGSGLGSGARRGQRAGKAVAHGKLIKRPLVLGDGFALIGFREDEWREALDSS
jgi:hypothetical protein